MSFFSKFTQIFKPTNHKLNPAWGDLGLYADVPQAIRMSKSFKSFVKEGYKDSDTLYKCISYIIRNGAAIPPRLYTNETRQKQIEQHPLLDLLKRPNNEQSGAAYREAALGYKILAGNCFQYVIHRSNLPPDEMWVLRPDRVEIQVSKNRGIIGYKYESMEKMINPQDIGHTRYWNPDDDDQRGMGMSPIEAAALNIDMQVASKKWNLSLLQNGARPPGIWKIPTLMGKNEREKLEQKLNEKFSGSRNAGKAPLFDGGVDWTSTGLGPAQMDYLDSLKFNGGAIANVLNIAPQLIGDTSSSTYDNMEQAKAASYTEAIFPELDDLYALWNVWLLPMYPDLANSQAYLYYDKESVEVVQSVIQAQKDSQAQRANNIWLNGLATQNEARALAGLPETDQGAVYRLGAILVPADKLQEYAEQSLTTPAAPPPAQPEPLNVSLPPTPVDKPIQEDQDDSNTANDSNGSVSDVPDEQLATSTQKRRRIKSLDLMTDAERKTYFKNIEDFRDKWENKAKESLKTYFTKERKAVVAEINKSALPASVTDRVMLILKKQSEDLQDLLINLYQEVSVNIYDDIFQDIKNNANFEIKGVVQRFINMFGSKVVNFLKNVSSKKVTQISEETKNLVREQLAEGVENGESIPQLARRLNNLYLDHIIPNRSTTISRTEVVGASNWAALQVGKASTLTLNKVWLSTSDNRTRPAHVEADGQEVGIDEKFSVGGEDLDHPGDSAGSGENIINCRCTLYFKRIKDEQSTQTEEDDEKAYPHHLSKQAYRRWREEMFV